VITLPNSNLIKASVENFGARRYRRQKLNLRFSHSSDPDSVEVFCDDYRDAIGKMGSFVADKTVVELNEVTEQWIGVLVICYLDAAASSDELRLRSRLVAEALRLARARNLKFSAAPVAQAESDLTESTNPKVE
jgi:hypothetical protein